MRIARPAPTSHSSSTSDAAQNGIEAAQARSRVTSGGAGTKVLMPTTFGSTST
ncbi:hypothetical protein LV779_17660 [Streptomyces thinghirensis]|nr:hypothetical protein [Streptomyces thinghirensis]